MSELVADCPRCRSKKITFDLLCYILTGIEYAWQHYCEAFCICRACNHSTVFILSQNDPKHKDHFTKELIKLPIAVNQVATVEGHISLKNMASEHPPEHLPKNIEAAFREGASCLSIACYNAAATMFRLCIDLATKAMLPTDNEEGLNESIRRSLGLRLAWMFDHHLLPEALRDLSSCIKDDGNDGAHEGSLGENDARDILEFTYVLLERIYTEPKRLELAKERRTARRSKKQ